MLKNLFIIRSMLFYVLVYVFCAEISFAQNFSKITQEQTDSYYKIPFLIITMLSITVIFCLYKIKNLSNTDANDSENQSQELVIAFAKLSSAIEKRDIKLREDYKKVKLISDFKTDLLLDVSHEIRTPMHAIINFADIGKKKIDNCDIEKLKFYFSRIEESGIKLLSLINSILDLTVLESGKISLKFENGSIADCVDDVIKDINSLIEKKNISVKLTKPDNKIYCSIDKSHIARVILNILSNSIKFSPDGSNINIDIKAVKEDKNIVGEGVLLSVIDEGVGIPENELSIIFNKFTQSSKINSDNTGNGIGLAICKEIIGLHQGYIWAENNKDKGAKFSFVIPIKRATS